MATSARSSECRACTTLTWSTFSFSSRARRMPAVSTKHVSLVPAHEQAVHGVARGARDRRDDRALRAEQPVQQRRLAHVGPAHERDARRRLVLLAGLHARAGAPAPRRAGRPRPGRARRRAASTSSKPSRANSSSPPSPALRPCSRRRSTRLPPRRRRAAMAWSSGSRPARASTTKTTRSASSIARSACSAAGPSSGSSVLEQEPAGVDQLEGRALPRGLRVVAVARGARAAVGDRLAPADDPVEKRGLADVGPAHERDLRDGSHGVPSAARFDSKFALIL